MLHSETGEEEGRTKEICMFLKHQWLLPENPLNKKSVFFFTEAEMLEEKEEAQPSQAQYWKSASALPAAY